MLSTVIITYSESVTNHTKTRLEPGWVPIAKSTIGLGAMENDDRHSAGTMLL